jgi:uncharacterized protein (TIGR03086 family)
VNPEFDLGRVAEQVAQLLPGIDEAHLESSTPCPDYTVGAILDHFLGLAGEFTRAATKETVSLAESGTAPNTPGGSTAEGLDPQWRTVLDERLQALAEAWRDPGAWDGMTMAGGVELPAPIAARVAADELVMHGWDLAVATGQPFAPDAAALQACYEFTVAAAEPGAPRDGLFGPIIAVPDDAPLFDRALGLAGRDPAWTP